MNQIKIIKYEKDINNTKNNKKWYKQLLLHHLIAIKIWTSQFVHRQLNIDLRKNKYNQWGKYLRCLLEAVRRCQYYKGVIYRGVQDYQNTEIYQIGKIIQWSEISSTSKSKFKAEEFANNEGMIFELNQSHGRDIEPLSVLVTEEEVLMPPYSQFTVTSVIKQNNKPILVKLTEIPQVSSSQILLWVDDNPQNNYRYAQDLEKENKYISVIFCKSTSEAIDVIQKSRFMIYLDDQSFRIVSDMIRFEEGEKNDIAGIQFLKYLIDNFNYDIIGNYIVSNKPEVLKKFIIFQ